MTHTAGIAFARRWESSPSGSSGAGGGALTSLFPDEVGSLEDFPALLALALAARMHAWWRTRRRATGPTCPRGGDRQALPQATGRHGPGHGRHLSPLKPASGADRAHRPRSGGGARPTVTPGRESLLLAAASAKDARRRALLAGDRLGGLLPPGRAVGLRRCSRPRPPPSRSFDAGACSWSSWASARLGATGPETPRPRRRRLVRQGVMTELLNPKTALSSPSCPSSPPARPGRLQPGTGHASVALNRPVDLVVAASAGGALGPACLALPAAGVVGVALIALGGYAARRPASLGAARATPRALPRHPGAVRPPRPSSPSRAGGRSPSSGPGR